MAERQRTAGASVQGWCMFAITSDEDGTVAVVLQPVWGTDGRPSRMSVLLTAESRQAAVPK